MKRRLLFIFMTFLMLAVIGYFYFNNILLPIKAKHFLEEKLSQQLMRTVTIGGIALRPLEGLVLSDITVKEKDADTKDWAQIKRISITALIAPSLKGHTLIIPSVTVTSPRMSLTRLTADQWNFSDLIPKHAMTSEHAPPPTATKKSMLYLRSVSIVDGIITYVDMTQPHLPPETITALRLQATFGLDGRVHLTGSANGTLHATTLAVDAHYAPAERSGNGHLRVEKLALGYYLSLLPQTLRNTFILTEGTLSLLDVDATYKKNDLSLRGNIQLTQMDTTITNTRITGTLGLTDAALSWKEGQLAGNGTLVAEQSIITLSNNTVIEGAATLAISALTAAKDTLSFSGDLTAPRLTYRTTSLSVRGAATATTLVFTHMPTGNTLTGLLEARDISLTTPTLSFEGDITLPTLTLSQNKDGTHIDSKVLITTPALLLPQPTGEPHRISADTIAANRVQLAITPTDITATSDLAITTIDMNIAGTRIVGNLASKEIIGRSEGTDLIVTGTIGTTDTVITTATGQTFTGNPTARITYRLDTTAKKQPLYDAAITLTAARLTGMPQLGVAENIAGTITVTPDSVMTKDLSLTTHNTQLRLHGTITDLKKPYAQVTLNAPECALATIAELFPEIMAKQKLILHGTANATVSYRGLLADQTTAEITATSTITNASIQAGNMPAPITAINGQLSYEKDVLGWKDLSGRYLAETLTLSGSLTNFSRPTVETTITGSDIDLRTTIKLLNNAFQITELTGTLYRSSLNIRGDVRLTQGAEPDIDIRGDMTLNTEDLTRIPPAAALIKTIAPRGVIRGSILYRGQPSDWRNWQLVVKAQSPALRIANIALQDVTFEISQRDQHIRPCKMTATMYGGTLDANGQVDLTNPELPIQMTATLIGVDLSQLRKSSKIKAHDISGTLDTTLSMSGPALIPEKLTGNGRVTITDGVFGQLMPQFKDAVFTGAEADFTITDGRIITKNAKATSDTVDLRATGWIGFDKKIYFDISPDINDFTGVNTAAFGLDPSQILNQAIGITVTGTIDNPSYRVNASPLKLIGNTTELLRDGIKNILQEIF